MSKILVVDDSPTQMQALKSILEKQGHDVITATNGVEGVDQAEATLPDLILMDVVMPELNGFQACRKITSNSTTAHIPVVLVTTKDQETDKVWGERQGAKAYVVKPYQEKEILDVVAAQLS